MRAPIHLALAGLLLAAAPAPAGDLGTEQQREKGQQLYDKYCAQCHGASGDGQGYATARVKPEPRDFTSGKYKFRTTPSGMMPTDDDLRRVIRDGLPYTSMPGWPNFTDQEVQNIIYYLKTFSEDFTNSEKEAPPIDIPEPPAMTEESIARGRTQYEAQGCAACHGDLGRGDGRSAQTLRDDWGDHIRPVDMTQRWTFRGGPTRKDIFRTFSTGLNGTPMPSYFDTVEVADRWDLVNYIYSLGDGDDPGYADLLVVQSLDDEFDLSDADTLFEDAPAFRFPLVGQIMEPGRNFYPSVSSVEVEAVYNRNEIAFRVRWNDMSAETQGTNSPTLEVPLWDEDQAAAGAADGGDGEEGGFWGDEVAEDEGDVWGDAVEDEEDFWGEGDEDSGGGAAGAEFSDAFAFQFPSQLPRGIRKPYFIFGDTQNSVDLWFVDLAMGRVQQFTGRGSDLLDPTEGDDIEVVSGYDHGRWTVLFKRELKSGSGISFEPGQFVPLAFSAWDGFNRERGNKRALSAWFYLYVEPGEKISPVGPMVKTAVGVLFVELLFIFLIRRKFAGPKPEPRSTQTGGAVPQGGVAG